MALVATALASGLEALEPTLDVNVAISRISTAFDDYYQGASVMGVPVSGSTATAKSAMEAAMPALNNENGASIAIAAGVTAYWAALIPLVTSLWTVPGFTVLPGTLVPPAGLASLQTQIQNAFNAAVMAEDTLSQAATRLANAIHGTQSGGTVTLQAIGGPPPPPVVTPII